jgi:hypothetical protein
MMKKLIRFLLVLALGAFLGYVFHNPIDAKLKGWFGEEKVENVNAQTKRFAEKVDDGVKAGVEEFKNDSANTE